MSLGQIFPDNHCGFSTVCPRLWVSKTEVWILYCQTSVFKIRNISRLSLGRVWSRILFEPQRLTNSGKALGFSGKNFPWEIPRVMGQSFGAAPLRTVWLPTGPQEEFFSLPTTLHLFHCLSHSLLQHFRFHCRGCLHYILSSALGWNKCKPS